MFVPQIVRRFVFEEWGGIETVVWKSCQEMLRQGIKCEILSTLALSNQTEEERSGVQIRRFAHAYPHWGLSPEQKHLLDKKGGNPYCWGLQHYLLQLPQLSLVHCYSMQRMVALSHKVARQRGIPYVVSLQGGYFEMPQAELEQMRQPTRNSFHYGRLLDPLLGYDPSLAKVDGLICVGQNEYEQARATWPEKSILHLPNGVDPQAYAEANGARFRQQRGIPAECKLLLCVGRLDPQKQQLFLLTLLSALEPDTGLLLVGPPTVPSYHQQICVEIQARGLQQRVWIIPGLPSESQELADAYDAADLFVLPSIHEPFGIVVLEAWLQRKAVLVSDVGGLRDLVRQNETGLRFQTPAEAICQARELLAHPEWAQALGEAGEREAQAKYTWPQLVKKLHHFYEAVIQRHAEAQAKRP